MRRIFSFWIRTELIVHIYGVRYLHDVCRSWSVEQKHENQELLVRCTRKKRYYDWAESRAKQTSLPDIAAKLKSWGITHHDTARYRVYRRVCVEQRHGWVVVGVATFVRHQGSSKCARYRGSRLQPAHEQRKTVCLKYVSLCRIYRLTHDPQTSSLYWFHQNGVTVYNTHNFKWNRMVDTLDIKQKCHISL